MTRAAVWIIDDEPAICWSLRKGIESRGYQASVFSTAEAAIMAAQSGQRCDVVISDVRLPQQDGFTVLSYFAGAKPTTPVIMMTAFGDLNTALKATQQSVFEYLVKPFDLKEALNAVDKALEYRGGGGAPTDYSLSITELLILGNTPQIQKLYREIALAARSEHPVMIIGPEGSPTESVASAIHRNSDRRPHPFLSFLPSTFSLANIEREFVGSGHRNPAGESLKTGMLGLVGDGSLFIEEVSDLPTNAQLQLLRVLEQGTFFPFGATEAVGFLGRVIASSTRELDGLVAGGEFDAGLYQRFKVQEIEVPSLDSRREDAIPIARALLARIRATLELSQDAESWILESRWPGDVRQLRNCLEHAAASVQGQVIDRDDCIAAYGFVGKRQRVDRNQSIAHREKIASIVRNWLRDELNESSTAENAPEFGMLYDDFLALVEPPLLAQLFEQLQYNRAATAARLGMHRSTLRQKMRKYDID